MKQSKYQKGELTCLVVGYFTFGGIFNEYSNDKIIKILRNLKIGKFKRISNLYKIYIIVFENVKHNFYKKDTIPYYEYYYPMKDLKAF